MTKTTIEEAKSCPKCGEPGVPAGTFPARGAGVPPGSMNHRFECRNSRCRWNGEICRIVTIRPDGSIPEPTTKRDKQYPKIPDLTQRVNDQIEEQLRRELDHSQGTHEVRSV
jgi:hypothetical protein